MSSRSSGTVVGSIGIVGHSGIDILGLADDVPAAFFELKLTWGT